MPALTTRLAALGVGAVVASLALFAGQGPSESPLLGAWRAAGSALSPPIWSALTSGTLAAWATGLVLLGLEQVAGGNSAARKSIAPAPSSGRDASLRAVSDKVRAALASTGADAIVAALDEILSGGVRLGASDIHLSPLSHCLRITYRIDGELTTLTEVDRTLGPRFVNRIKVLANLEIQVQRTPQDGRLVLGGAGESIEARVSTLPTETGERVVMRLVRGDGRLTSLAELGLSPSVHRGLESLLAKPQGLLFVTGPVGSGKTTTLYAALGQIVATRGASAAVVTIEDPIERKLPFATQTQVHAASGRDFARTLRSVLRQDPNVLMIGEIRDRETAEIAIQAGLTGHLILTTLHADGAAGPFARLIDMQVEPFTVASATVGALSQRLARRLCPSCRREGPPRPEQASHLTDLGEQLDPDATYGMAAGCPICEGTGYEGRLPLAELLVMTPALGEAIIARRPTRELRQLAEGAGMRSLLRDGLTHARAQETSLEEVLRVCG